MYARLTNSAPPYRWVALMPAIGGGFQETFIDGTGDAYELNGERPPADTVVYLTPAGSEMRFAWSPPADHNRIQYGNNHLYSQELRDKAGHAA